jgi:hypothetical protein
LPVGSCPEAKSTASKEPFLTWSEPTLLGGTTIDLAADPPPLTTVATRAIVAATTTTAGFPLMPMVPSFMAPVEAGANTPALTAS